MKINVLNIQPAWSSCDYKWQVWVSDYSCFGTRHKYILDTLIKWFGSAEYFWDRCFLCGKK